MTCVFWGCIVAAFMAVACSEDSPLMSPSPSAATTPEPAAAATDAEDQPQEQSPDAQQATPLQEMAVERAFPKLSFGRMVDLTFSDDGTNRLFLVLQPGRIQVFENEQDVDSTKTFLNISGRVNDGGNEEGLLGLAFDPDFRINGHFYVNYTASSPRRTVVSRFSVSADDPDRADSASERVILEVEQPFGNHNGGQVAFGPDGYLYIGLGDGGDAGDPRGNGQDLTTLLGTILRIDVGSATPPDTYVIPRDNPFVGNTKGAREEIWAYGLRNPWRFSFDPETGDLWAGDVGQNTWEEIDVIKPGLNYGWNVMEGAHCYLGGRTARQLLEAGSEGCDKTGLEEPVAEYRHDDGCSVTGGFVYRGSRLPSLDGAYVYGDFCSGKIWALRYDGTLVTEHLDIGDSDLSISAFGRDQSGELYILSFDNRMYRLALE